MTSPAPPGEPDFDHAPRTRLVFGPGRVALLGSLARDLGATRVLIVTDAGVVKLGLAKRAEASLRSAGLAFERFEDVRQNPTTEDVRACLEVARAFRPDLFLGFGGGSAIDAAKGANFLLTNGGRMEDYWGRDKAKRDLLPMIAVPTTAGTGTETQSFALIEREEDHQKMACGAPSCAPRIALLDPELTRSLPADITATGGLDTIGHAVESYVSRARNAVSALFARESFARAHRALPRALERGDDLAARGDMLLAAAFGGLAIENSMLGAAHSAANPLTAHHRVTHGLAVGTMLPHVVEFNAADAAVCDLYRDLAHAGGLCDRSESAGVAVSRLVEALREHLRRSALPERLSNHGVTADEIPRLAAEAARQWTARFNPRDVSEDVFASLYRAAL